MSRRIYPGNVDKAQLEVEVAHGREDLDDSHERVKEFHLCFLSLQLLPDEGVDGCSW